MLYVLYASYVSIDKSDSLTLLWFLPVLFSCTVLYLMFRCMLRERFSLWMKLALALVCFAGAYFLPKLELGYPMGLNVAVTAFGFLLLGNVCFPLLRRCEARIVSLRRAAGAALTGTVMLLSGGVGFVCAHYNSAYVKRLLMADARYGHYGLFLAGAIVGLVFVSAAVLFLRALPLKRAGSLLSYLGRNSFAVYVLHKPVVMIMRSVFRKFAVPAPVEVTVTCLIAVAASCLVSILLERYAPVLLGRGTAVKAERGSKA